MQQVVFANVSGETLLLLIRSGKYCDYAPRLRAE